MQYILYFGFVDGFTFSHNDANEAESKTTLCFIKFARWWHWWRSMMPAVALFCKGKMMDTETGLMSL